MHKSRVICLGIAILLGWNRLAAQPGGVPVVVISIDGLKPSYVLDAERLGIAIPNLRRMMSAGSFAQAVTGVLPTVTYSSHATMVTGVSPARHGILTNLSFDPFRRNQDGWMWYAEDIKAPTLWDAVNRAGLVTSSVDWPVTVGAPIRFNIAQIWRAMTEDDHKLLKAVSTPGLLDEAERTLGPYPVVNTATAESDAKIAEFNAWMIEQKRPRFHTGYFASLDAAQHRTGPDSPETYRTLEAIDAGVGKVWQAATKADPRTAFCVVSDHGFARFEKTISVNVALQAAGLIELDTRGRVTNWRAMTYGPAVMIKEKGDVEARAKVAEVLKRLVADPSTGVFRILEPAEIQRAGAFPDAAFIVGVKPGFGLNDRFQGNIVESNPVSGGGNHGLLPELPDMDSAFFIVGPAISKRQLARIDMRDIAPTLASILGVPLGNVEGKDLLPQLRALQ